jgi:hypothetical protein
MPMTPRISSTTSTGHTKAMALVKVETCKVSACNFGSRRSANHGVAGFEQTSDNGTLVLKFVFLIARRMNALSIAFISFSVK